MLKDLSHRALAIVISTATVTLIVALGIFSSSHGSYQRIIAKDAEDAKGDDRCSTENDKTKITRESSNYQARSKDRHGKKRKVSCIFDTQLG